MATAAVTNQFTASTTIVSDDVDTNFSDLVTFLNGSVLHLDGSKTMTGAFNAAENGYHDAGSSGWDLSWTTKASISVPAGSWLIIAGYSIEASTTSSRIYEGRIYNVTDAAAIRATQDTGEDVIATVLIAEAVTLADTKTIALQTQKSAADGTQLLIQAHLTVVPIFGTLTIT